MLAIVRRGETIPADKDMYGEKSESLKGVHSVGERDGTPYPHLPTTIGSITWSMLNTGFVPLCSGF